MSDQLPHRWLKCPNICKQPILNQFIAFKTPLSSRFDTNVPAHYRFTPSMVFNHVKNMKQKLGLWIDLTNTSRFYDKTEITERRCQYVKLSCRGHGETPSNSQTDQFINIVSKFRNENPDDLIGVHCTHGFNRTGFLIAAYMVLEEDVSLDSALYEFGTKRPNGIYKQDYIDELIKRFDDDLEYQAPPRPDWCDEEEEEEELDYDDNDRDTAGYSQSDSVQNSHMSKKELRFKNKKFMIASDKVTLFMEKPKVCEIRKKARKFCKFQPNDFPGAQPVSMNMTNISLLTEKPYQVSWKADGVRYMMLIEDKDEVYMIDRDNCVFRVDQLYFPHNKFNRHLKNTLLDGEMVIDKVNGIDKPRYLVYDIIRFEDINLGKDPFYPTRLQCIELEIINPRYRAIKEGLIKKEMEPFSVIIKRFWDVGMARQLLEEKFAKTLHHEPDGLIFQPSKDPYQGGPCPRILKWKPSELNSVDFKLIISKEDRLGMIPKTTGYLYVGDLKNYYGTIKYEKSIKDLHNKIIECKMENSQWVFMRERTDKSFPNSYTTAAAVVDSIQNPVTKEYLLDKIKNERYQEAGPSNKRPRRQ